MRTHSEAEGLEDPWRATDLNPHSKVEGTAV
jgi:hypothetical protein